MSTHKTSRSVSSPFSPTSSAATPPTLLLPANTASHQAWLAPWIKVGTASLAGYQLWAVEQRVTDRDAVLPVIVVLTGDKNDSVPLDRFVLAGTSLEPPHVPLSRAETKSWEDTCAVLKSSGARVSDTSDGFLPVTSLASMAPALYIVQIPDGDYETHMRLLYLNINLRRLGLGGRSGLRLAEATPAQGLHFRQAFRLPIPAPGLSLSVSRVSRITSHSSITSVQPAQLTDTVIDLVKLVQHALSLFGLGVVRVTPHLADGLSYPEQWQAPMDGESKVRLVEGDGLLCDTTLAALALFRVDIGEPLLHFAPDDSVLSPVVLAGLLSLIISTRGKLITLGCNGVPKDPLARRLKFLYAVQTFQRTHRLSPVTPYLTRPLLSTLSTLWARARHVDSTRTSKVLGRAIRTKIDALDPLHERTPDGDGVEGMGLEALIREFDAGVGGATVGRLWGVRSRRNDKGEKGKGKGREVLQRGGGGGAGTDGDGTDFASETESYGFGMGRGVMKGVKEKAGRASKLLGENFRLGTAESSPPPMSPTRLAPSLMLFEPSSSPQASHDESPAPSRSPRSAVASRLSAALNSDLSDLSVLLSPRRPAYAQHSSSMSVGLGPPPPLRSKVSSWRRSASEAYSSVTPTGSPIMVQDEWEPVAAAGSVPVSSPHRRRRHSIGIVEERPEPFQRLSRKRLEMDVNLRMTAWALRQRERKLAEMVDALQIVHSSYGEAIESLQAPLKARVAQCDALEAAATSLMYHVDSYSTSTSPIAHLSTGSSRLLYAQSVLEDKLTESVLEFSKMILAKVGPGGTLDTATKALDRERSGVRRFVQSLRIWGEWLGILSVRIQRHLRLPARRASEEKKDE